MSETWQKALEISQMSELPECMNVDLETRWKFTDALDENDLPLLRKLFVEHPDFASNNKILDWFLAESLKSDPELLDCLVEHGADIHSRVGLDDDVDCLVHKAVLSRATDGLKWLLGKGAQVNVEHLGKPRCLALAVAVRDKKLDTVRLLVEHGADVNAVWDGQNSLSWALQYGLTDIAEYLRSHGAKMPKDLS